MKFKKMHFPVLGAKELLKYIGPGFLVTVGFIDPGNWAANVAAGSGFGYSLLWMVTLSTIMLIILQHNAAHLGIASGLCISEAITKHFPKFGGRLVLATAIGASISTALAEILGGAIGLNMLFNLPIKVGALITSIFVLIMLYSNSYKRLEKWIIAFVSLIGISFIVELILAEVNWKSTATGWVTPAFPLGSIPVIMSVLGAVVMPHNLFLHSEVIQSRQWNIEDEGTIKKQLKYEFLDTFTAMIAGWAINSAMIIVAAAVFFKHGFKVTELQQAQETLRPLLGEIASLVFAIALVLAGFSSSITASLAAGSIYAGIFKEPLDVNDNHTRIGIAIAIIGALICILFTKDTFKALIWSQVVLSVQLPITVFALIKLTSSEKVMGKFANSKLDKIMLWSVAAIISGLNIALILDVFWGIF